MGSVPKGEDARVQKQQAVRISARHRSDAEAGGQTAHGSGQVFVLVAPRSEPSRCAHAKAEHTTVICEHQSVRCTCGHSGHALTRECPLHLIAQRVRHGHWDLLRAQSSQV